MLEVNGKDESLDAGLLSRGCEQRGIEIKGRHHLGKSEV